MKRMTRLLSAIWLGALVLSIQFSAAENPVARIYAAYLKQPAISPLQDFSYAGYGYGTNDFKIPDKTYRVTDYGIYPDEEKDQTEKVQQLIDRVGEQGGGVVYFPRGKYCFHMDSTRMQYLTIDHNHIVLRGEGSGEEGTVFHCGNNTLQEDTNPWLSPALIRFGSKIQSTKSFWGVRPLKYVETASKSSSQADPGSDGFIQEARIIASVTQDSKRGEKHLFLENTSGLKSGDIVLLAMYNTSDDGNLLRELIGYSREMITDDLVSAQRAGREGVASFQWLVEVDKLEGKHKVLLKQPLKCDVRMKYKPQIAEAPMIREVGIEHIRFESAWDGLYLHHGGNKYSPYMSMVMDYGWNAVNFCRVAHGWMRGVVINGYTNPLYIQDSRNVTVEEVVMEGPDGHCGIKIYAHASDNLIRNVRFRSNFTHILSAEGNAYGNVFTKIEYEPEHISGQFDFHGFADVTFSPPAWNLFELINGLSTIDGGGARYNFPHTAKGNVWWNCVGKGFDKSKELFAHWPWSKDKRKDHHAMYPGSIIVGYRLENSSWMIDNTTADRDHPLVYVESLNEGPVYPVSLYEAQKEARMNRIK